MDKNPVLLSINGGSSSIKFSLFEVNLDFIPLLTGEIERIGTKKVQLNYKNSTDQKFNCERIEVLDYEQAAQYLINWLEQQKSFDSISAIGHRIVHGMQHTKPELVTNALLQELRKITTFDPEHLPQEIKLIEVFRKRLPGLKQIACFDTAFHTTLPKVAQMLTIPRRYYAQGIKRYGFHGLSYTYLMEELDRLVGGERAKGKIILAHLGSGASLAAVKDGNSMDTSMGFSPAAGLPMGTRTGDLDPGVACYLMQSQNITPQAFNHMINKESGLLGISETSPDVRDLIDRGHSDSRAREAIELFCYQTKKWIGAFTTVLEGLDILVFSGGIGEHSPEIRSTICDGLEFMGVELDEINNMNNRTLISTDTSKIMVYVIKTNEELMIAKLVTDFLNISEKKQQPNYIYSNEG